MQSHKRGLGGNVDKVINKLYVESQSAFPTENQPPPTVGGQIILYFPEKDRAYINADCLNLNRPNVGDPAPRKSPVMVERMKLRAVVQPMDTTIYNNSPSNYPGTLFWMIYPRTIWNPDGQLQFWPNTSGGFGSDTPWTWDAMYYDGTEDGPRGTPTKNILDFGVCAISPHRWANRYVDRITQPIVEINEVSDGTNITGTHNPVPPYVETTSNGYYAGGSNTCAYIESDLKFDDLTLPYGSLIVMEYQLQCERQDPTWWDANVANSGDVANCAVKINGLCSTEYRL